MQKVAATLRHKVQTSIGRCVAVIFIHYSHLPAVRRRQRQRDTERGRVRRRERAVESGLRLKVPQRQGQSLHQKKYTLGKHYKNVSIPLSHSGTLLLSPFLSLPGKYVSQRF